MSPNATKVYEQYLALPEQEREDLLAHILEGSDEPAMHPLASEWDAEIRSRIDEIDAGKVEMVSWDEYQRILKDEP